MKRRFFHYSPLSQEGEELINLTPLIDVLFVVLIMFILIAPLLDLDRIQLAPKGGVDHELVTVNNNRPIKIFLHRDDTIWLGKHPLTLGALETTLIHLQKSYIHEVPELYCDEKASFGIYQRVKNAVENAGFEQLDVILKRE